MADFIPRDRTARFQWLDTFHADLSTFPAGDAGSESGPWSETVAATVKTSVRDIRRAEARSRVDSFD